MFATKYKGCCQKKHSVHLAKTKSKDYTEICESEDCKNPLRLLRPKMNQGVFVAVEREWRVASATPLDKPIPESATADGSQPYCIWG